MAKTLLAVDHLQMRFQGITALDDVSFGIDEGSITALIGPNGAGKTTMFNCVTGMYLPTSGRVSFDGQDITGQKAHQVSRCGIARTFQNLALFGGLTVLDNEEGHAETLAHAGDQLGHRRFLARAHTGHRPVEHHQARFLHQ